MSEPWANAGGFPIRTDSGADLHLDLAATGVGTPRAALIAAVREAIRTGRLTPGTRLPSSRSLAVDLGLARNTVAGAYAELVAEGWLSARQGSGTRVAHRAAPARTRRPAPPADTRPAETRTVPGRPAGSFARPTHDLRTGTPDVSAFPRSAWLASARRALTAAPSRAFAHGDLRGTPELRGALADYLARARGVRADPERIVVCAGFAQGLALLARALGGAVAVEEYGLRFHRELLEAEGSPTPPLTLDAHGARTTDLDTLRDPARVRAVLLTPGHQYPTGVPLHPDRRAAVVDWARRRDALVLEDDYDGEFRYDRHPVGALQGLDPDRVVYLGTASKALAPALRLAWMVLPDHLLEPVLAAKTPAEWTTGALDQLTLADFLGRGAYDRHVRTMRQRYRARRDRLVDALAARAPQASATGIAAGLHAVLELPSWADEFAVRHAARRRGVGLDPLASCRHPAAPPPATPRAPSLIVGYGTPPEHAYPAALDALLDAVCAGLAESGAREEHGARS